MLLEIANAKPYTYLLLFGELITAHKSNPLLAGRLKIPSSHPSRFSKERLIVGVNVIRSTYWKKKKKEKKRHEDRNSFLTRQTPDAI